MADAVPPHEAAFEAQFEYMVDSIEAGSLAPACLTAGLISDRQRDECFRVQEGRTAVRVMSKGPSRETGQILIRLLQFLEGQDTADKLIN